MMQCDMGRRTAPTIESDTRRTADRDTRRTILNGTGRVITRRRSRGIAPRLAAMSVATVMAISSCSTADIQRVVAGLDAGVGRNTSNVTTLGSLLDGLLGLVDNP